VATVYELTFLLGLGLLATVVAIYVLSVTQIGKSTELSSEKQQDIIAEQKQLAAKQIERLQNQLDEAREIGHLNNDRLMQDLAESQAEIEIYETGIKHLRERTLLLGRNGAVVWPGSSFLATIVFSAAATAIIEINEIIALALWIIGIFTLIFGIYRIFRTLGAIQEVTIASRDAIDRLPEAVKSALLDIELSRKPELELAFTDEQPPLHAAPGQPYSINFKLSISKGEIARNISLFLACPPGFTFTKSLLCAPPSVEPYKNYSSILLELDNITLGVNTYYKIIVQTPATPGNYTCIYMISCEGFKTDWIPFDILIK
jgi:hypothetical protein